MTARLNLILSALIIAAPATQAADTKLQELDRKVDILTQEIERLKLGSAGSTSSSDSGVRGSSRLGKLSFGGYGEIVYKNLHRSETGSVASGDTIDMLRAILYVGYKFNDWITFASEYEFEHATTGSRGEVGAEVVQLDFTPWGKALGLRVGLMLMPFGMTNIQHEPTNFHGVNRPSVDRQIIPSTWRENGLGLFGEYGMVSYKSYLVTGLQAASDGTVTGFKSSSLFRSSRDKGSKSRAEDFASITQINVAPLEGTTFGAGYYVGEADQDMLFSAVPVNMWEVHAQGEYNGLEANAQYVDGHIGGVDALNIHQGNAIGGTGSVATDFFGGYVTLAYDVLNLLNAGEHYLAPFVRYERYDTQQKVPGGWVGNPATSRLEWTLGLTYKPISQVVAKFDHQIKKNQAGTGIGQTNLGIGYVF
jgi:hypothetical protein